MAEDKTEKPLAHEVIIAQMVKIVEMVVLITSPNDYPTRIIEVCCHFLGEMRMSGLHRSWVVQKVNEMMTAHLEYRGNSDRDIEHIRTNMRVSLRQLVQKLEAENRQTVTTAPGAND